MLVHHADVQFGGVVRREGLHFFAADVHLALVRLIHAEQNAHQRGLSGAVFAQQREDLALFDAEADVVAGYDAGKAFGDMTHFHNIVVHLVLLFLKGLPPRGGARKKKRDTPRNGGVSLSDMLKTCSALTVRGNSSGGVAVEVGGRNDLAALHELVRLSQSRQSLFAQLAVVAGDVADRIGVGLQQLVRALNVPSAMAFS